MAKLATIARIKTLKNVGVFREFAWPADLPQFRQRNLIYGFNGTGKTTLTRIFSSLESGEYNAELRESGEFELELSDGSVLSRAELSNGLANRVLVFNVDFVEHNLRWKEGTANPVFYLGTHQNDLSQQLEAKEKQLESLELELPQKETVMEKARKAFSNYKTARAQLIAARTRTIGRGYEASHLASDYGKATHDQQLSDDQLAANQATLNQTEPLPRQPALSEAPPHFAAVVERIRQLGVATLGTLVMNDLAGRDAALPWLGQAYRYHKDENLSSCLLCGGELTKARLDDLASVFDGNFEQFNTDIADEETNIAATARLIDTLYDSAPRTQDVSPGLRDQFEATLQALRSRLAIGRSAAQAARVFLSEKKQKLNESITAEELISAAEASTWEEGVVADLANLNTILAEHNDIHDAFEQARRAARKALTAHFLAEGQAEYQELKAASESAQDIARVAKRDVELLKVEIDALKQQMRQHRPAAESINNMVHQYLGHAELEVETVEEGYQLRRGDAPLTGSLSEGEKTAIALCYFLTTTQAEGRKLEDLIIVVDDPISSLDSRALNYAYSLVISSLWNAGQLIMLTHNLAFMNEAKKKLKGKTESVLANNEKVAELKDTARSKATAALFFLHSAQVAASGRRGTTIQRMPKLIRDYESEYHYLFGIVLKFSEDQESTPADLFLMPNVLRKVMEMILAFKFPGCGGLTGKVEALLKDQQVADMSPAQIRALERLAQLESHGDNVADFGGFSSMTIEETKDAATTLLEIVKKLDPYHHERMCSL